MPLSRSPCCTFVLLVLLACLSPGCTRPPAVSGTVTWEGKRVEKGYITFFPDDRKGVARGAEIIDGRYCVRGLSPGRKRARVTAKPQAAVVTGNAGERIVQLFPAEEAGLAAAAGNDQVLEVTERNQTFDIELSNPAGLDGSRGMGER